MTRNSHAEAGQPNKRYEDLQEKSQRVVDEVVAAEDETTHSTIADRAGCSNTHVTYVKKNFPHIIDEMSGPPQVTPDGGEDVYQITLSSTQAFRVVRLLSDQDLANSIFEQVRRQGVTDGGNPDTGLDRLFDDDGDLDNE